MCIPCFLHVFSSGLFQSLGLCLRDPLQYRVSCVSFLDPSCGLFVVSTEVGGVPEVLPANMIKFAPPTVDGLVGALTEAIPLAQEVVPTEFHAEVRDKAYVLARIDVTFIARDCR